MAAAIFCSIYFILVLLVNVSSAFDPLKSDNKVWTHFDFTLSLGPRQRECYHQYLEEGMVFAVSYRVVSGDQADQNFAFVVSDSYGTIVRENYQDLEDSMQLKVKQPGVYNICLGNEASRFYTKKIHIYIDVFDHNRFEKVVEVETEHRESLGNITNTIRKLNEGVREMRLYQMKNRRDAIHDWYLLTENLAYVNRWSFVQCVVIIASGILQVYILRTLFKVPTDTRKPRC